MYWVIYGCVRGGNVNEEEQLQCVSSQNTLILVWLYVTPVCLKRFCWLMMCWNMYAGARLCVCVSSVFMYWMNESVCVCSRPTAAAAAANKMATDEDTALPHTLSPSRMLSYTAENMTYALKLHLLLYSRRSKITSETFMHSLSNNVYINHRVRSWRVTVLQSFPPTCLIQIGAELCRILI